MKSAKKKCVNSVIKILRKTVLFLFIIALSAASIGAFLVDTPVCLAWQSAHYPLTISGYGTLGMPMDDRSDMSFLRDVSQEPDNPYKPYDEEWMWNIDSRMGIQANYRFSEYFDLMVQGVLRNQFKRDMGSAIETAFLAIHPFSDIKIRAGRIPYDAFLMSDIRNIGYAYLWVRPIIEFYGWIPIFSVDGVDATWNIYQGTVRWAVKAQTGYHSFYVPIDNQPYEFETKDLMSLTVSRQSGPFTLKLGCSTFSSENEVDIFKPIISGLKEISNSVSSTMPAISDEAASLAEELAFEGADVLYLTLGMAYDSGEWVIQGELARSTSSADVLPHGEMGYLSVGHRFGDFTPYAVFSKILAGNALKEPLNDWSAIGQEQLQNMAASIINNTRIDQKTYSLGTRWDFHNRASVKLQWDHTIINDHGYGLWYGGDKHVNEETDVNVLTVNLEFIF
ncbi:conserved exported hypothetical protein [Desulfamplus magnetovallimortis]|uniref:Porin domain-containing protein n=1 Tax=Desulfamplus magnetovallimortis TaxID=1246637 RepID=A0A1W1HA74_9BACT|nr:hypothetical protein [Desulfamplus magnetovallimortis]SLM29329.1 conserved exported hypothetical protein [Desulfamplus magnetovallimortis]